ncbi:hypothetical protein GOP47_0028553, partial [Adiantum capillus-veneris]
LAHGSHDRKLGPELAEQCVAGRPEPLLSGHHQRWLHPHLLRRGAHGWHFGQTFSGEQF